MIKDTKFKKGQPSWNKGKSNTWLIGIPRTEEVKHKISEAHKKLGTKPIPYKRSNPNIRIECKTCSTKFEVVFSRKDKAKYCSFKCRFIGQKGKALPTKGLFKATSYGACHYKVRKLRGTPSLCEVCGTTTAKKFEWANLTGNYADINDYKRMCASCHDKFDGVIKNLS